MNNTLIAKESNINAVPKKHAILPTKQAPPDITNEANK